MPLGFAVVAPVMMAIVAFSGVVVGILVAFAAEPYATCAVD